MNLIEIIFCQLFLCYVFWWGAMLAPDSWHKWVMWGGTAFSGLFTLIDWRWRLAFVLVIVLRQFDWFLSDWCAGAYIVVAWLYYEIKERMKPTQKNMARTPQKPQEEPKTAPTQVALTVSPKKKSSTPKRRATPVTKTDDDDDTPLSKEDFNKFMDEEMRKLRESVRREREARERARRERQEREARERAQREREERERQERERREREERARREREERERREREERERREREERERRERTPRGGGNPYTVLGIKPGASEAEIKRAYYALVKKYHPDHGGTPAQFSAIKDAYDQLMGQD